MSSPDLVHRAANRLGECPLWSIAEQALYWVDGREPGVYRLDPSTGALRSWPMAGVIGSVAFRASGGLVAATADGIVALDVESGAITSIARPESHLPDNRFNDGRCDRRGRFWAGTMSDVRRDPVGTLYRLDADHTVHGMLGDIIVPNSIAWSPDDRTMYLADTYRFRIMAYDFDLADGVLSTPRLFAETDGTAGRPDGSAIDEAGCVWNAEYAGGRLVRYTPDGRIDRIVPMPVTLPTCCCFGGPDLGTLFITSATQRLSPAELATQPLAGSVFAIRPGVKGLPESAFAG